MTTVPFYSMSDGVVVPFLYHGLLKQSFTVLIIIMSGQMVSVLLSLFIKSRHNCIIIPLKYTWQHPFIENPNQFLFPSFIRVTQNT